MKRAFIDLDGTLIDSSIRHEVLLFDLLEQNGILMNEGTPYLAYKRDGFSTQQYLTNCLKLDVVQSREIANKWMQHIEDESYLQYDKLYDDTVNFLSLLQKKGYTIYYITARKNKNGLVKALEKFEILEYAKELYVVSPKGAVEEKLNIIKRLMKSNKDILIGDTEVESSVGRDLSINTFLLNRGFRSKAFWNSRDKISFGSLYEVERLI